MIEGAKASVDGLMISSAAARAETEATMVAFARKKRLTTPVSSSRVKKPQRNSY